MAFDFSALNAIVLSAYGGTATHSGGDFSAIIDDTYTDGFDTQGQKKVLNAKTSAVTLVSVGDSVTFGGNDYIVRTIENDSEGMTAMLLEDA